MLSAITILLTFLLGLITWRVQLIGKRQTEIAEEALVAFAQAVDSIAAIRSPLGFSNESEQVRREAGFSTDERMDGESFKITLLRYRGEQDKFDGLRKIQLLCRFHLGEEAAEVFQGLHAIVYEIIAAAHVGAMPMHGDLDPKHRRELESKIFRGLEDDPIERRVKELQETLEENIIPYLKADSAIFPIGARKYFEKKWKKTMGPPIG